MGRGRGRGRKVTTIARSHEEKGSSGEEVVPARKRRGRPQKHKIEVVVDVENFVEDVDGGGEDAKLKASSVTGAAAGVKRGRPLKESPNIVLVEENSNSSVRSSSDESAARTNGFRQIGNRRKSTPRRAAEAGVECN